MMQKYFEEMHDPRQQAKVQHKLSEIIVLVICAVISGCDVWEDIADEGQNVRRQTPQTLRL